MAGEWVNLDLKKASVGVLYIFLLILPAYLPHRRLTTPMGRRIGIKRTTRLWVLRMRLLKDYVIFRLLSPPPPTRRDLRSMYGRASERPGKRSILRD